MPSVGVCVLPVLTDAYSLKNHGVEWEVDAMFDLGAETLALPLYEKMKYEQGDNGDSFGYATHCWMWRCQHTEHL